jgi:S-adenosylmethionine:tRNA ribosyltransferase-isomerase
VLLSDFEYELPPELIAQRPPERRDGGRLLRLDRASGALSHHRVLDLPGLLPAGCLLVINDSRVLPARLMASRPSGGRVEILLLERERGGRGEAGGEEVWRCMLRASKGLRAGELLTPQGAAEGDAPLRVLSAPQRGRCLVALSRPVLLRHGRMPLPPYIRRAADGRDVARYQTVYAREEGSVAAPTAGLHFSESLLAAVQQAGAQIARVTLHVGPGTFVPVRCQQVLEHRMEQERYRVPAPTAAAIRRARQEGRPVVAVGTTVVRTLESTGGAAGEGSTELFIVPGHRFRVVDALLTNFHLPGSTLLMLVSALAGRDRVLRAYAEAVRRRYRFYSYGDAMLIV